MADISILPGDLDDPRIRDMIRTHITLAARETAPGSSHALDVSGLKADDVDFWVGWRGEDPVGIGALKRLGDGHGEVKSMYVSPDARRTGAGGVMLRHIVAAARGYGLTRLSLETGSWDYFTPAWALYRAHGFVECPPFGDYWLDPNSLFMTVEL